MKIRLLIALTLFALLSASAMAQGTEPEEVVLRYFESVQAQNWEEAARWMDPEELANFKEVMMFLAEADESGELLAFLFGVDATVETARDAAPEAFLTRIMEVFASFYMEPFGGAFDRMEVLGSVPEGDDTLHVVTRSWLQFQGASSSSVDVITIGKRGAEWFVRFDQELDFMLEILEAAFGSE